MGGGALHRPSVHDPRLETSDVDDAIEHAFDHVVTDQALHGATDVQPEGVVSLAGSTLQATPPTYHSLRVGNNAHASVFFITFLREYRDITFY